MSAMSRILTVLMVSAAVFCGCGKKESAPVAATDASTSAGPRSPRGPISIPDQEGPAVIADTGDTGAVLDQLTAELRRYVVTTRSVPKDFEEFATKSKVQYPPAPAGKKYAIKSQAIVLVKK